MVANQTFRNAPIPAFALSTRQIVREYIFVYHYKTHNSIANRSFSKVTDPGVRSGTGTYFARIVKFMHYFIVQYVFFVSAIVLGFWE